MNLRCAALAAGWIFAANAAQAQVIAINEGFDALNSPAALAASGWVFSNNSSPIGPTGWFQGDATIFPARTGPDYGYLAANYNNAAAGGTLANYVFTSPFASQNGGTVSFYARSAGDTGFTDQIRFGLTHGGASAGDFVQYGAVTLTDAWTLYSFTFAQGFGATGRAAIEYVGLADASDYVGIDNVVVNVVPEPETWALFGLGLAVCGVVSRRRRRVA